MERFFVIHNDGSKEIFKPRIISQTIISETNVDEDIANKIQRRVSEKIYKLKKEGMDEISTSDLRAEVSSQLLKEREFDAVEKSRMLGMTVMEFEDLIENGCNDNANIGYSPEMIAKYAYDSIAKQYALQDMPKECADAHIEGFVHHHDLEFFNTRPNCMNMDLRFFARNGLKIDGHGLTGSVAKPAKSLEVMLNHMLQAWMAGAVVFSGGQGYVNFNTLLAPFARGRSYEEIKQAIQGFIYNCNMSLVCRGAQILFSSIGVDLSVPEVLANEPAIGPNGVPNGTYSDYQEEADLIFRAILEVSDEKDGNGAYHRFPNILFNIREGDLDKYEGNCKLLHEKGANNPTLYYNNCVSIERTTMGCRSSLPMNYAGNYEDDCCNTGNFMYSTLNLPLIALKAKDNIKENRKELRQEFYNLLGDYCDIIYDTLIYRRECIKDIIYNKHMSDFLLQTDKETKKPLWDIDRTTITLGFCGLYECLQILEYEDGESILNFINSKKELYHEKDGLRWSVIGSPAESTSHRFAEIIKDKYPDAPVQGVKGSYYLTNSSHIPVSHDNNIIDHIKNAAIYHPLSLGGNILHIWSGEVYSNAKAIWSLNKKILETGIIFWAYSKVFTFCQDCGFTINDNVEECPICKSKALTTYDRCFSGDTKIFIKKGKIIKPIQLKDFVENYNVKEWKVPVFDSNQQKYIWCSVKRGIKNPIEDMIKIDFNKGYSVTCTPSHNFFKYQMSRTKSMYDTISAKELHVKDKISNHRCPELVTNVSENVLGTFIGFVLGDGTFANNKDSKNIGIRLKCYKSDKRDYIEWLLKSNNLDYTFSIDSDDRYESTTTYSFYIGASNIGNIAYDMFNKYSNKRDIIDECYNEDLMLGVFAGLINSDGSVLLGRKNQIITTFNQADRKILYLFYWIGMLLGVNPSLSFTERKSYKSLGRVEMSSFKMYELLQIIHLREPFNSNVLKGECRSDARNVNGMCSVKSMSEVPKQESYCIEVEHSDHNTIFNGVLAQNCTGYYLPTNGFNNGKKQEFKDRYRHAV